MARVLLSNVRPDPVANGLVASLMDPFGERFTRGQGLFTLTGHLHHVGTHLIAQNIQAPTVVLEYPTLSDFRDEVRKGFDVIGISFMIHHTERALEMCRIARAEAPHSTVTLGGHGTLNLDAAVPAAEQRVLFDHVCRGDGVPFMRALLGEPVDAPVRQGVFPRNGMAPPWLTRYPPGIVVPLVAGFGCTWRCEFCASARFWNHQRIEFAGARELYADIQRLYRVYPGLQGFFIIDEDWMVQTKTIRELIALVSGDRTFGGLRNFNFITESSIAALRQYDPDELLLSGLSYVFIGYESKFADALGFAKRAGEAKAVFDMLRARGICTNAAMMVGWDFHTPENLPEDLEYLISCRPTYAQFSRVIPYPGTALWERLRQEGRLDCAVPWKDYHNYGGSFRHHHLTAEQIHRFIEDGYRQMYERLGPSLLRMIDTYLNGYDYCRRVQRRELREDKAEHFRRRVQAMYPMLTVCRVFAPNAQVRRLADEVEQRRRELLGPPSLAQRAIGNAFVARAASYKARNALRLRPAPPRTFPCKRYIYDRRNAPAARPFRVEYDNADLAFRMQRWVAAVLTGRTQAGSSGRSRLP